VELFGNSGYCPDHASDLKEDIVRHSTQECNIAHSPIEASHVLAKDRSVNGKA
jgi:hypothetical protein